MLIEGLGEVYMVDRDNTVFHVPALTFWKRKQPNQPVEKTLVDGEMVIDQVEGQPVPRYLIYDIIKFEVCAGCVTVLLTQMIICVHVCVVPCCSC